MSPEKRAKKAGQVRNKTSKSVKKKSSMIMDVNQHAVENALKGWGVSFLIHGHTHRPAEHDILINNNQKQRIVLGDWGEEWSYLECHDGAEYKLYF